MRLGKSNDSTYERLFQSKQQNKTGAKGFEPLNDGAKTRCLTTWPRPNYL
jgi:hypothetical protein